MGCTRAHTSLHTGAHLVASRPARGSQRLNKRKAPAGTYLDLHRARTHHMAYKAAAQQRRQPTPRQSHEGLCQKVTKLRHTHTQDLAPCSTQPSLKKCLPTCGTRCPATLICSCLLNINRTHKRYCFTPNHTQITTHKEWTHPIAHSGASMPCCAMPCQRDKPLPTDWLRVVSQAAPKEKRLQAKPQPPGSMTAREA